VCKEGEREIASEMVIGRSNIIIGSSSNKEMQFWLCACISAYT